MLQKNLFNVDTEVDTKYSKSVNIPQYLPKNEKPILANCFSVDKYKTLVKQINDSSVTEEEKEFLIFAATRHIVFDYAKIADYYAHSNKEMQRLMENNALVIIDFNDALANGYIELSERLINIVRNQKNYQERMKKYNIEDKDVIHG